MKKPIQQVLLGAIALAATVTTSTAALSVSNIGGASQDWNNPADTQIDGTSNWLTGASVGGTAIVTEGDLDAAVAALGTTVNSFGDGAANLQASDDPSDGYTSRAHAVHNIFAGTNFVQSKATGAEFIYTQAIFRNAPLSNGPLVGINISFSYWKDQVIGNESIDGLRLYFASDVSGGAWSRVTQMDAFTPGTPGSPTLVNFNYTFGTPIPDTQVGNENRFRFMWVDDNGVGAGSTDDTYIMDNHSFTAVPEPSTGLLAASAAAALGFIRRRRK